MRGTRREGRGSEGIHAPARRVCERCSVVCAAHTLVIRLPSTSHHTPHTTHTLTHPPTHSLTYCSYPDNLVLRNRHGLKIVVTQTGKLGTVDMLTLLLTLTTSLALLAASTTAVDFLAMYVMKRKSAYRKGKYHVVTQEEVDNHLDVSGDGDKGGGGGAYSALGERDHARPETGLN